MRRTAPALVLLAAAVLHCGPALFSGPGFVLSGAPNDLASQFLPWREFGFRELGRGNLALWNPHVFGGAPFFGAFESALLYPPNWVHLVFPLHSALNFTIAFHVFLAGLLTYAWCRMRDLSPAASTLAGLMFMLSGPVLLHAYAGHLPPLAAMTWAPGILLALEGHSRRGKVGWLLFGATAVAMQVLAGNPQYVYYTAMAAFLVAAGTATAERRAAPLIGTTTMYFCGAALTAVQLLAGVDAARESVRAGGLPFAFASSFSLPPENLVTLAVPWFLGDIHRFHYFGRCYIWEGSLFVSLAGCVLAASALLARDKRPWRMPAAMAAVMLILALGARLPLYKALYHTLPGYDLFRGTAKFGFLACLFLSALAGAGLDRLKQGAVPRNLSLAALVLAAAMMVSAAGLSSSARLKDKGRWGEWLRHIESAQETFAPAGTPSGPKFAELSGSFAAKELFNAAWVMAAVAALLFAASAASRPDGPPCRAPSGHAWAPGAASRPRLGAAARPMAVYGLALLAVLELGAFSRLARGLMSTGAQYPERWRAVLRADPGDYRVLHDWSVHPNVAMRLGLYDLMGYSQLSLKRYAEFIAASQGADAGRVERYPPVNVLPKVFSMLRLRYVLKDPRRPPQRAAGDMPRLNLLQDYQVIPGKEERLAVLLRPGFDPRKKVILETEPRPVPARPRKGRSGIQGDVRLLRSSTDGAEMEVVLKEPSILLVTDNFSRGWKLHPVESSQRSFQILPANHTLMAVPLEAGRHVLKLEYRPTAFAVGAWTSIASLAVFCLLAAAAASRALRGAST